MRRWPKHVSYCVNQFTKVPKKLVEVATRGHVDIPFKALYVKIPGMNISSVVFYLLVPYLVVSDSGIGQTKAGCGHVKEF